MGTKWITVILGLWLVISPFVLGIAGTARWNNIIVGIILAVVGYTGYPVDKQPTGT